MQRVPVRNPTRLQSSARRALRTAAVPILAAFGITCTDPTRPDSADDRREVPSFAHSDWAQSTGIYRIPYADGLDVLVTRDHHTHRPVDRIDMRIAKGTPIVAAASGWIRAIVDHNGNDPGPGDGLDKDGNPHDDSLEHACQDDEDEEEKAIPDSVVPGLCQHYNNYVWVEHPNGEWTKYSHVGTGTVRALGWDEDDWIDAGQVIGLENDIGRASGSHLHFEVAVPNVPGTPLSFSTLGGFIQNATNLVPRICDIPNNIFVASQTYTADPCNHQPPAADAGGPYAAIDEGAPLVLDGTGSSDPDGLPLTYRWEPAENFIDATVPQPVFVASSGIVEVTLTVYDQVEALSASSSTTITVNNVAPTVTIDPAQVTVINEGGTVTLLAEFTDPGFEDTHAAAVDWGVPPGHPGIEVQAPTIQILDQGGLDRPRRGRILAAYQYGDNDDGTGFTIEVSVTDSDDATGMASFDLTVNNVAPFVGLTAPTILIGGVPTVLAKVGDEIPFGGEAQDPGSDDLTLSWDWGDGVVESRLSLVAPPTPDPLPSPTVDPRLENDPVTHTFSDACMYDVTFSVTDDDGGENSTSVKVLIVGAVQQFRNAGYWTSEYRFTKNADFTPETLACYLDIVNHVSTVFSQLRPLASIADAVDVLWTRGPKTPDELLERQVLTTWLNFAAGAFGYDELVDTNGDGIGDAVFAAFMSQVEVLRANPARTQQEVLAMKDVLEQMNGGS